MTLNILRTIKCFKTIISPIRTQYFLAFQERSVVVTGLHNKTIAAGLTEKYTTASSKHVPSHFSLSPTNLIYGKHVLLSHKYSNTTSDKQETDKLGERGNVNDDEYEVFFIEDKIIYLKAVSNLKLYNLIAAAILLPTSSVFVGPEAFMFCATVAISTSVLFSVIAKLCTKIVGELSLDNKKSKVKMSHLTFWGKRNNVYFDVQEIVPLSDAPGLRLKSVSPFCTYVSNDIMYMVMTESNIIDHSIFQEIFGS